MRILQLLSISLIEIEKKLPLIYESGFDAIQINPLQPLKTNKTDLSDIPWWLSYQPIDFTIGNQYGTKEDFMRLCEKANAYGISMIPDVVINHVANQSQYPLEPHQRVNPEILNHKEFFKEQKDITDWNDRNQTIHYCMGLPGLNLEEPELQKMILRLFREYIVCGAKGFRIDAAKHIALPEEGNDFWDNWANVEGMDKQFVYGEIIYPAPMDTYKKYFKILSGEIGDDENLINFVETHDVYFNHWTEVANLEPEEVSLLYKKLAENLYPHIFYFARPNSMEWSSDVVRNANQIHQEKKSQKTKQFKL